MSYPKGRAYENQLKRYINDNYGEWLHAERVLLSGQRGEGDIMLTMPTDESDGRVFAAEVKVRKSVPKMVYEWLGEHDLLVMKRIGDGGRDWLVTLNLDHFLALLAQLSHKQGTSDNTPTDGHGDGSAEVL